MDIITYLESRGLIEEISSPEVKKLLESPRSIYLGIDPTAPSLHLGNLVGLIVLKMFQNFGHRPVIVIGGATAMIGDPSGKSTERPLLTSEEIDINISKIKQNLETILDFSQKSTRPMIVNNASWYNDMSAIDFLRDIGKQFRMGPMLGKESVRSRLASQEGMSFTEFSYQLLQGYDFCHLFKEFGVEFQIGGSDQYGNITAGIEYTRKSISKSVYGISFPLLLRSDGKKFGKSEDGAIWLDQAMLSPFAFYQHIVKFPDGDMVAMLKKLTFLPLEKIDALEEKQQKGELAPFALQKLLASELTEYVHGKEGLKQALSATDAMAIGSDQVNKEGLKAALSSLPTISLEKKEVIGNLYLDLLCKSGLLASKGEARRLIQNNGAYLNKIRVQDLKRAIEEEDLIDGDLLLISSGKKKSLVIQLT